jgi:hypothetical protein
MVELLTLRTDCSPAALKSVASSRLLPAVTGTTSIVELLCCCNNESTLRQRLIDALNKVQYHGNRYQLKTPRAWHCLVARTFRLLSVNIFS